MSLRHEVILTYINSVFLHEYSQFMAFYHDSLHCQTLRSLFWMENCLLTFPHFLFYQLMVTGLPGNLGLNARDLVTVEFKHVLARALTRAPPMEGKIASV